MYGEQYPGAQYMASGLRAPECPFCWVVECSLLAIREIRQSALALSKEIEDGRRKTEDSRLRLSLKWLRRMHKMQFEKENKPSSEIIFWYIKLSIYMNRSVSFILSSDLITISVSCHHIIKSSSKCVIIIQIRTE